MYKQYKAYIRNRGKLMDFWEVTDSEDIILQEHPDNGILRDKNDLFEQFPDSGNTPISLPAKKISVSLKQKAAVQYYTDPENPETFGSKTNSYIKAYKPPDLERSILNKRASNIFQSQGVKYELDRILAEQNVEVKDRVKTLADIMSPKKPIKTVYYGKDGEQTSKVETDINPTTQLKAIEILNKMDGTYSKVELQKEVAMDQYKQYRKEQLKRIRQEIEQGNGGEQPPDFGNTI